MKERVNIALFQKILKEIIGNVAFCDLIIDETGSLIDCRLIKLGRGVEEQSNRDVNFIVGKTIKEVIPEIDQPWMDKFSSVIIDNKSIQFSFGNDKTFKSYNVNTFSIEENKIVMIIEDITVEKIAFENLIIQNIEKEKLADELIIANKELAFQDSEKVKRSAELVVANKELLFQNAEKEKRASELVIANIALNEQIIEKQKRASELVIANEELNFQNLEKEKSAIELVIMMRKAEESAALKSSFLANMSAEIRAPMNAILGFTELLKNTNLSGEKQLDYFRIIEKLGNSVLIELDFLTSLFNPNFIKFEEVIQQNIYSNLSVNELAQLCNMSLSSFKRKFAEIYKVSPIKYFLKIKLHRASELLKNKNNRISHIAIEVGFESLATFNRSFRAQYGVTPSKFRLDETD